MGGFFDKLFGRDKQQEKQLEFPSQQLGAKPEKIDPVEKDDPELSIEPEIEEEEQAAAVVIEVEEKPEASLDMSKLSEQQQAELLEAERVLLLAGIKPNDKDAQAEAREEVVKAPPEELRREGYEKPEGPSRAEIDAALRVKNKP